MDALQPMYFVIRSRFTHPTFAALRTELDQLLTAAGSLGPRLTMLRPGRLLVRDRAPLGVLRVDASPDVPPENYFRHLAAALLMGNTVQVSPHAGMQLLIARNLAQAQPTRVTHADSAGSDDPAAMRVELRRDHYRIDEDEPRTDAADRGSLRALCLAYSRPTAELLSVRSSGLADPPALAGLPAPTHDPADPRPRCGDGNPPEIARRAGRRRWAGISLRPLQDDAAGS